ncbi:hypothetical protein F4778DRAFT_727071 [Xylariomycetidae sp. FL2044]|nr:hypothetical protein F4778DRAFT_727071 [Xylariomycetidae sp. FL2044]
MRFSILAVHGLVTLAGASPLVPRQDIEFDMVEAAPDPSTVTIPVGPTADVVTYDLAAATASAIADPLPVEAVEKRHLSLRTACEPQPAGSGPVPSPDTDADFLAFTGFSDAAAHAPTPAGYSLTFSNLQTSSGAYGYMGFTTVASYDTDSCANQCNSITGCLGFNIYFERDPSVNPGPGCEDPNSTTAIKCVFWGGYVAEENAKNDGQWRANFHVVIAGSNGYMKIGVPNVPGFTGESLGNRAINAPLDCNGKDTYMGSKIFSTSIFDPSLCGAACQSQNEYNLAHPPAQGKPMICKFFTTYLMAVNGRPEGQYCAMYTEYWDASHATNDGQWRGSDHYTVGYAFSYTNTSSPGIPICPTDIDYLESEGGEFCTEYIHYTAPVVTVTAATTAFVTQTASTTAVSTVTETSTAWTTITGNAEARKRDATAAESDYSIAIETVLTTDTNKAAYYATATDIAKRAAPTPSSITGWEPASISEACSSVATGTVTTTEIGTVTVATTALVTVSTAVTTTTATITSTHTVPGVILSSPTPIVGSLDGATRSSDDDYFSLDLPFAIGAYGQLSTHVYLSINGRLSLTPAGYTWSNNALPDRDIPDLSVCGYYDDLYIYEGTQQGIYYDVTGLPGARTLVFEWYASHFGDSSQYYHFTMSFYESWPGVVDVVYYTTSDGGASATVGAQDLAGGRYMQFAYNTPGAITDGLTLRMDTNSGTFTTGTVAH